MLALRRKGFCIIGVRLNYNLNIPCFHYVLFLFDGKFLTESCPSIKSQPKIHFAASTSTGRQNKLLYKLVQSPHVTFCCVGHSYRADYPSQSRELLIQQFHIVPQETGLYVNMPLCHNIKNSFESYLGTQPLR